VEASGALIAGRYRVIRTLGAGGMASVVLAEDERLGREVALKRLHPHSADELAQRFQREARIGASLAHPNVVRVFDSLTEGDDVVLVMEYVAGEDLSTALRRGALERPRGLEVLRAVGAALDHAHEHGVVHRDVKPANVLLGSNGTVKLADLGIATAAEMTRITRTGVVPGTVAYMAPEQLEGNRVTAATDIYAFATVAYEVLSGHRARAGATPLEIMHRIATEPAPSLRDSWPEAPADAVGALCDGMSARPEERPSSAGELVSAISTALEEAAPRPAPTPRRPAPPPASVPPAAPAAPRAEPISAPAAPSERAPTGASASPSRRPTSRRRRTWALPLALLLVAGAAVGAVLLATGAQQGGGQASAPPRSSPAPVPAPAKPKPSPTSSPAAAVQAFYTRAAAHRFDAAWSLAAPAFRSQLGGFAAFQSQFSSVRSITFQRARTSSQAGDRATVAVRTTSVQTARTDHCQGPVDLVRGAGGWMVEQIHIACSTQ